MTGLLQPAQGHQLHQVADMHGFGGAVEADIGGDALLAEQRVQLLGRRAVVIGPARHKGAQEFGLELGRGRHGIDSEGKRQAGNSTMTGIQKVIGLMSGTSLDGVDAALLETDGEDVGSARPQPDRAL